MKARTRDIHAREPQSRDPRARADRQESRRTPPTALEYGDEAATPYLWFRISPRRIQAWREVDELPGRDLMRDGRWMETD